MFFFTFQELAYQGCLEKHTVKRMLLLLWVSVVILRGPHSVVVLCLLFYFLHVLGLATMGFGYLIQIKID